MLKNIEFWDLGLTAATFITVVIGGVVCCWWVRPADCKLKKLDSHLDTLAHQFNSRIDSMRDKLLESEIKIRELRYERMVESCLHVRRAFQRLRSSFGILGICKAINDIGKMRSSLGLDERMRLHSLLSQYMPKEDCWKHPEVVAAEEAEVLVPVRVWQLYTAASHLLAVLHLQIMTLGIDFDAANIKTEMAYKNVEAVLPGQYSLLSKYGTAWYGFAVEELYKFLIVEIRKAVGSESIKIEDLIAKNEQVEPALKMHDGLPSEFRQFMNPNPPSGLGPKGK